MISYIPKGKYIIAVSGGVDSVALLHSLAELAKNEDLGLELVVAHFDHGIRPDSDQDSVHVEKLADNMGLKYELGTASLGAGASEQLARDTRYNFLKVAKAKHSADGIITAHHKDDLLETAIINLSRGTGRHGLSSLKSDQTMLRPLLGVSKEEIIDYAKSNFLEWREDSTNNEPSYLRNYIRANVVPKMSEDQKIGLHDLISASHITNTEIDKQLAQYLTYKSYRRACKVYPRRWFNQLPHDFACNVVHHWLRSLGAKDYSKKQIEKMVINLKVGKPGKIYDIDSNSKIELTKRSIRLLSRGRTSRMVIHEAKKH